MLVVIAAGTSRASDDSLAEIVVTAQKRTQSINEVPLSITAVTGATLIERGVVEAGADRRRDDVVMIERRPVMHGGDADRIILAAQDDRGEALALLQDVAHLGHDRRVAQSHGMIAIVGEDDELRRVDGIDAFAQNPTLKVLIASGYYDLATPYVATEYTFSHMDLAPSFRENIRFEEYEAGHMMYVNPASLAKLKKDAADFIGRSTSH